MTKVTYHDREEAAPVVTFHAVTFKHAEPVDVPDDWPGLEVARSHPFFSVDEAHAPKQKSQPKAEPIADEISIREARQRGQKAYSSGHHRKAPAHFSRPQAKAWLEGFDRARRQARK